MRKLLPAIFLSASLPTWAGQPVTFAPHDDGFVVSSTATGSVRKEGPFLAVSLPRHTLREGKQYKTPVKVFEYRVGLARNNAHGRWDVERWSDSVQLGFTLTPGDTRQLPAVTALVPIDILPTLRDSWLVVQLKVQHDGPVGMTYSHSNKLALD